ncbi:VOC family protein [Cryobacterium sp. TMT1-19]|uniref:VOC family protein n=1 Tax=Cryobacterium sp. TMT1-19 TaxID=1259231 RepID=UPI00351918BB
MRLSSAVMFVRELDRSVLFYKKLLGFDVTVRNNSAALLAAPTTASCTFAR